MKPLPPLSRISFDGISSSCERCEGTGQTLDHAGVGRLIRSRRESIRITLRAAAKGIGISPAYLCDLERGRRPWTIERAIEFDAKIQKLAR